MSTYQIGILLVGSFLLFLRLRFCWLSWKIEDYTLCSQFYILQTHQSMEVAAEMAEIWTPKHMLWEVWRWDFDRYIVCQDHLDDMLAWRDEELLKESTLADLYALEAEMSRKDRGDDAQDDS